MMKKKRILFVSDVPDFKGGAERSLFDLMANPHIEPMLCVPEEGPISKAAEEKKIKFFTIKYGSVLTVRRPFKILDIFRTLKSAIHAASSLKIIAKENKVLAVHTNGLKAHGVACLARLMGGAPVIIHFRAIPFTQPEKLFWQCVRLIASHVILVSRPCWPTRHLPGNVKVIFNGIHLPDPGMVPKPDNRDPFVIGFIGRLQFTKGVDTLIEWFRYARTQGLNVRLVIRGEAAPDERAYEEKCRALVQGFNLSDVCVFEGKVEGFSKIYGGIHVNAVPSVVPDPLPRSVMEACALGIPVLGYPAGGIPYMFEDKKSGFLVKDAQQFHDTLKMLMGDIASYNSVSKAAITNAQKNFDMQRLHEEVWRVYKTLL